MNLEELQTAKVLSKYTLAQQEKDYYQYKVLSYLSEGGGLLFKGGTALAKVYGLPRFSEDLDFNVLDEGFRPQERIQELVKWLERSGDRTELKKPHQTNTSFAVRLSIEGIMFRKDPRGRCGLEIDISFREKAVLEPDVRELSANYADIMPFLFAVMKPQEIAAEKVRAIMTRKRARDLYDLHFLICKKNIAIEWQMVEKKLSVEKIKADKKDLIKRIDKLSEYWKPELSSLVRNLESFETVAEQTKMKL